MDSGPVKIYSAEDTPRLRYIAGIILEIYSACTGKLLLTNVNSGKHPVINYSPDNMQAHLKFIPIPYYLKKELSEADGYKSVERVAGILSDNV